jgi:hypothetical protein
MRSFRRQVSFMTFLYTSMSVHCVSIVHTPVYLIAPPKKVMTFMPGRCASGLFFRLIVMKKERGRPPFIIFTS